MSADACIDFTAGALGGGLGIIVGQPFDTIKVRLQTQTLYHGPVHCFTETLRQERVRGLFKGLASPLFGSLWTNAIVFSTYGSCLRMLDDDVSNMPTLGSITIAGSMAGLLQTLVITPTELVKCRLQVQTTTDGHHQAAQMTRYGGPVAAVREIWKAGGVPGLYRGWSATIWREVPAFGLYFAVYEGVKRVLARSRAELSEEVGTNTIVTRPRLVDCLLAGGCAGVCSWTLCYPFDVVKSSIQTLPDACPAVERTIKRRFEVLYRTQGLKAFTNGLSTTILRAFPVNAVTLCVYELSVDLLVGHFED